MGTHSLSAKYNSVTGALKASLTGTNYQLPDFGASDAEMLIGRRVALVTTHGPELPEFDVPLTYLRERGAVVDVVTQDWLFDYQPEAAGMVVLAQWLAVDVCARADMRISDANVDDYDAVIIIGGAWNPIMLRSDPAVLRFIRETKSRGVLIASICHGPQVLISAGAFPSGTDATGVDDIRLDMTNAGFNVLNDPVVYDEVQSLLTSRNPETLKEFCVELGKGLLKTPSRTSK
jgi:protease I